MSDDKMSDGWIEQFVRHNPDRERLRAVGMVFPGDPGYVEPPQAPTPDQRLELARAEGFRAGYHCRWHKDQGAYTFDPALAPGDPEGAYAAWVAHRGEPHGR